MVDQSIDRKFEGTSNREKNFRVCILKSKLKKYELTHVMSCIRVSMPKLNTG